MLNQDNNNVVNIKRKSNASEKKEVDMVVKKTVKKTPAVKKIKSPAEEISEKKVDVMIKKLSKKMENKSQKKASGGRSNIILGTLVVLLLACVAAGAIFMFVDLKRKNNQEIQEKNSIIEALEKANREILEKSKLSELQEVENKKQEELATLNAAELNIKVLNESGVSGAAGKVTGYLKEEGYAKSESGNGEGSATLGTTVYYKSDEFEKEAQKIMEILKEKKIEASVAKAKEGQQASADIVVIVGK